MDNFVSFENKIDKHREAKYTINVSKQNIEQLRQTYSILSAKYNTLVSILKNYEGIIQNQSMEITNLSNVNKVYENVIKMLKQELNENEIKMLKQELNENEIKLLKQENTILEVTNSKSAKKQNKEEIPPSSSSNLKIFSTMKKKEDAHTSNKLKIFSTMK
jgi:hypothetical protein